MMVSKAKPYHDLLPHLIDAWEVFNHYWRHQKPFLSTFCQRYGLEMKEVYALLSLAVYLHDIGKTNQQWQDYLEGKQKPAKVSHPLLSFATCWRLFEQWYGEGFYENVLFRTILTSILAHHHMLHQNSYQHVKQMKPLCLPADEVNAIMQGFFEQQKNLYPPYSPLTQEQLTWTGPELAEKVKRLRQLTEINAESRRKGRLEKVLHTFFLSIICLCDNLSSQIGQKQYEQLGLRMKQQTTVNEATLAQEGQDWLPSTEIQQISNQVFQAPNELQAEVKKKIHPFMVIRAGCGEGKTGAALTFARYWMEKGQANRIIITLPTRFSVNSMYLDLIAPDKYHFPTQMVGLYHSEASRLLAAVADPQEETSVNDVLFRSHFYQPTITVSTIDHLLYSLIHAHKYADRAFGNILQSVIIFDEIHYYERFTLQKIAECIRILKLLQVPHLLMSATLPESFIKQLNKSGKRTKKKNPYIIVTSEGKTSDRTAIKHPFRIHKASVPLYDPKTKLNLMAKEIIEEHLPYRQMIIVNQVERAKAIAKELMQRYPNHNIICYHSEFTAFDRQMKEKCIKILFKDRDQRTHAEKDTLAKHGFQDQNAVILVTTQICELSLDISCDVQLTELAPIDALAQRGGRLHRGGIDPCWDRCRCPICRSRRYLPADFQYRMVVFPLDFEDQQALYPYIDEQADQPHHLLQRSWELLAETYTFPNVVKWVNQLYPDFHRLEDKQLKAYFYEDIIFGKQPKDRFGKEYDADKSEGLFRVRQSHYRTIDVIPYSYQKNVMSELDLSGHSKRELAKNFYQIVRKYSVPMKQVRFFGKIHQIRKVSLDQDGAMVLYFAEIPYDSKLGFSYDEAMPSSHYFDMI